MATSPRASQPQSFEKVPLDLREEPFEWAGKLAKTGRVLDERLSSLVGAGGSNVNVRSGVSAVGSIVGTLNFWGKDAAGADVIYGGIDVRVRANTAGAHSGFWDLWVYNAGAKQIVQTWQGTP